MSGIDSKLSEKAKSVCFGSRSDAVKILTHIVSNEPTSSSTGVRILSNPTAMAEVKHH